MQRDVSGQFESLADQFVQQLRDGEAPDIEQYVTDYPELEEKIRRLFPVMQMMESGAAESVDEDEALLQAELEHLSSLPPQRKLGEYQIVREIGRGGMGIVYQARQESLGRYVALKLLPESAGFDERRYKRFQQEARASGMLVHSNIVPVFGIGRSDDVSYFVMQYIDGTSLDKVIKELKTVKDSKASIGAALDDTVKTMHTSISGAAWSLLAPPEEIVETESIEANTQQNSSGDTLSDVSKTQVSALSSRNQYYRNVAKIGKQVSDALQHAHSHKILHRDIKPANLLLDSDGHAWVTDFGLAKLIDEANLTKTGETVGTLRYLPPEQFDGKSDARSDVYSLGLTLYEMLTLKPAFEGDDFAQLLQNVTESVPVLPRKLEPRIPRDLATIVTKAIARSPDQRYQTAGELHDDLSLFLDGKPIRAKQTSELDRLIKAMKRRPLISTLSVLLLTALVVGSALVTWKWQEAAAALSIAEEEAETRQEINDFLFTDLLNYAQPELEPDPDIKLRTVFDRATEKIDQRFGNRPLVEADIRVRVGVIYMGLSKPEEAKRNFERAFSLRAEILGLSDPLTDEAYFNLALAEHDLGNYRLSLELLEKVVEFRNTHFGERSSEAMEVKPKLADVLRSLGYYQRAKEEIEDYIRFAESSDPISATLDESQFYLAKIYYELGEFDEAEKVLETVIPKQEKICKSDDGEYQLSGETMHAFYLLLSAQNTLASISESRGYPLPAIEIHRSNYEESTERLGPEHATTLDYAANLARALLNSDQISEAKQLLDQTIPISQQSRGAQHPKTLALNSTLAILLFEIEEYEAAERLMTKIRDTVRDNYGQDHPNTVNYNYNVAAVYFRTGQWKKSQELMEDVVRRSCRILGEEHPQSIVALADLATINGRLGNSDLAERDFTRALELSKKRMRPHHPEVLTTIMGFALFYERQGRFDMAEPLLEQWLEGLTIERGPNDSSTILGKNSLAISYAKQGKFEQALPLYVDCYEYHKSGAGPGFYKTFNLLIPLTDCEYKLGNHQANADRLEEFCEACIQEGREQSWEYLRANNWLGRAHLRLEHYDKAESVLLETFKDLNAYDGEVSELSRSNELRNAASRLAGVYQKLNNDEQFELWRNKHRHLKVESKQLLVEKNIEDFGPQNAKTISSKRELAKLLIEQDNDEAAHPILIELFDYFREKDGLDAKSTVDVMFRLAIAEHGLKKSEASATRIQEYVDLVADEPHVSWSHLKAKNYLGRARIELDQHQVAETVLLDAFEGIEAMQDDVKPSVWRSEMRKVTNRLMELYKRMGNEEEQAAWSELYHRYKKSPGKDEH